jgi:hypothetical protein
MGSTSDRWRRRTDGRHPPRVVSLRPSREARQHRTHQNRPPGGRRDVDLRDRGRARRCRPARTGPGADVLRRRVGRDRGPVPRPRRLPASVQRALARRYDRPLPVDARGLRPRLLRPVPGRAGHAPHRRRERGVRPRPSVRGTGRGARGRDPDPVLRKWLREPVLGHADRVHRGSRVGLRRDAPARRITRPRADGRSHRSPHGGGRDLGYGPGVRGGGRSRAGVRPNTSATDLRSGGAHGDLPGLVRRARPDWRRHRPEPVHPRSAGAGPRVRPAGPGCDQEEPSPASARSWVSSSRSSSRWSSSAAS